MAATKKLATLSLFESTLPKCSFKVKHPHGTLGVETRHKSTYDKYRYILWPAVVDSTPCLCKFILFIFQKPSNPHLISRMILKMQIPSITCTSEYFSSLTLVYNVSLYMRSIICEISKDFLILFIIATIHERWCHNLLTIILWNHVMCRIYQWRSLSFLVNIIKMELRVQNAFGTQQTVSTNIELLYFVPILQCRHNTPHPQVNAWKEWPPKAPAPYPGLT